MEESKHEMRQYLSGEVNPVLQPLVEELVKKRPSNVAAFINEYSGKLLSTHPST